MKKILLTVVLCVATLLVVRAQSQRGTVVIQNSGKKALPQVNIVIEGLHPLPVMHGGVLRYNYPII